MLQELPACFYMIIKQPLAVTILMLEKHCCRELATAASTARC